MAAGDDAAAHSTAVVVELHFEEGRAYARGLTGALAGALAQTGAAKRHPAEQAESKNGSRDGDADFASEAEEDRNAECDQTAADLHHACGNFRIDLRDDTDHP